MSGVSNSAISRVTGIEVIAKNFNQGKASMLPQRLVIIGQGNDDVLYSLDKWECDGSAESVATRYGNGSPLHLAAKQLFPTSGAAATFPVTILPVKIGDSGFVAAKGFILVTGTATKAGEFKLYIGGKEVVVAVAKQAEAATVMSDIVTAVNAVSDRCVNASMTEATNEDSVQVQLLSRWSGALGNRIGLTLTGDIPGLTFTLTAFADGVGIPNIETALTKVGEVWETFFLDTFDYKNSDGSASSLLDVYQVFGEGRWSVLGKKGCLVAHGCIDDYATRTAITDNRPSDKINFLITSVGANELPFAIGARGLLEILTTADSNPALDYKGTLTGLKRGDDSVQEDYTTRNQSVLKGASTNIPNGSVAELNDIVTFYHASGDGKFPVWRYVCKAVKIMNIVFNLRLICESNEVKAAALITDDDETENPSAVQPKMFKTWFANLAKTLGKSAIISDVKFTIKNIKVEIDSENPDRINYIFPAKVSGNVEVISGQAYIGQYTA